MAETQLLKWMGSTRAGARAHSAAGARKAWGAGCPSRDGVRVSSEGQSDHPQSQPGIGVRLFQTDLTF